MILQNGDNSTYFMQLMCRLKDIFKNGAWHMQHYELLATTTTFSFLPTAKST